MVCESLRKCTQDCNYYNSLQKLTNRKPPEVTHVQYVIANDGKMSNRKLLSTDKMPLMAKWPSPTYI